MIATEARHAVRLAQTMADFVPAPEIRPTVDADAYRAWEDLMLLAAHELAAAVRYDEHVLDAAIGPPIEVGVNPEWRVLLMVARLEAASRHGGRWRDIWLDRAAALG